MHLGVFTLLMLCQNDVDHQKATSKMKPHLFYTAENFWHGLDESGTRTKKIVLITHLHVLFSTVLNDVKL